MKKSFVFNFMIIIFACFILAPCLYSEDENEEQLTQELKKTALKVYMDCRRCDMDYIRTEITFVNFVRDRQEADVHVLVTTQRTGAGGREYTLAFIGQKDYTDLQNTLQYVSNRTETDDDVRRGLVHVLKMGLVPYIARTPISDFVSVSFKKTVEPTSVEDKWNFWVFNIGFRGFFSGEKSRNYSSIRGNFSANRVTPESKLRMSLSANYNESNFEVDDEKIVSTSDSESFSGLYVKSLNEHWSVGAWFSLDSSTYSNVKINISPAPAVEFNLFPYSESTRRQLRFLYKIAYSYYQYREETIYDKTSENLWQESLSITFEMKEPWGEASASLEGSHYFHDLSKYRLRLFGELSLKLFKGFSFDIDGGYSRIHDQLSLPKEEASLDEILLQRKELATNYDYFLSVGFSYTFGSIYSNVVNPRFGGRGWRRY